MEYLNAGATISSTYSTVLSATTNTKLLVKTVHATNTFSGDTSIYIRWYDSSEATTYSLSYNTTIPQTASYQALDGTFVLDNDDYLEAQTDGDVDSIDLTISYLEITNTEG